MTIFENGLPAGAFEIGSHDGRTKPLQILLR